MFFVKPASVSMETWKTLPLVAENPESGFILPLVPNEGKHHRVWTTGPWLLLEKNNSWFLYLNLKKSSKSSG